MAPEEGMVNARPKGKNWLVTRKAAVARGAMRDELPEVRRAPTTQDLGRPQMLGLAFGCTQRQQPQKLNLTRVYFTHNTTASR